MKDLLQRLKGDGGRSRAEPAEPRISLAAFGKHPGWDDHIPGIGVETEALAYVKQTLYVAGIGGQVDAGAWEKLEPEKRLAGFDHTFLWLHSGHVLMGQFWSSTDGKGRAKYPMVLCIDSEGIPAEFLVGKLLPGLERVREACKGTTAAATVTSHCQAAQEELRSFLGQAKTSAPAGSSLETRRRFLERPELGPDRLGLLRVLHDLKSAPVAVPGARGSVAQGATVRSHSLRVPLAADSSSEGLLLWGALLRTVVPEPVPLLLVARAGTSWLDVVVGEPATDDLFGLQATPKASPLATQIPYELATDAKQQLQAAEAKFLGVEPPPPSPPSPPTPKTPPPPPSAAPSPPPAPRPVSPPASSDPRPSGGGKLPLLLGAGVVVLLAAGGGWWLFGGRSATPAAQTAATGPSHSTETQVATPPKPSDERDQQYSKAVAAAQTAAARKDYPVALAQAQAALALKPDDAAALKLKTDAQAALAAAAAAEGKEKQFQNALAGAQSALARKDYPAALGQAQTALALKPDDATALKLQSDAQAAQAARVAAAAAEQREKDYQAAIAAAQAAARTKDYSTAEAQVQTALRLKPNDSVALQLKTEVQTALNATAAAEQKEKGYQAALSAAQLAQGRNDYATALSQAQTALALKPGDPAALKVQSDAQAAQTAAASALQKEKDYQTAMAGAQSAFARQDYQTALSQAQAALALKPDDATATKLNGDAQTALTTANAAAQREKDYHAAVSAAQAAFARKDYAAAQAQTDLALKLKPDDTAAANLKGEVQQALAAAKNLAAELVARLKPEVATPVIASTQPAPSTGGKPILTNSQGMQFVWVPDIPPGGAYVGRYEVTQAQFAKVMGSADPPAQEGDLPAKNVAFEDAQGFCQRLSDQEHRLYSLPSREEWLAAAGLSADQVLTAWSVFAASAGSANEVTSLGLQEPLRRPARVGSRGARPNGLADVLGNVREWTGDKQSAGFSFDTSSVSFANRRVLFLGGSADVQKITGFRCLLRGNP